MNTSLPHSQRQLAVLRLRLKDGTVLRNRVLHLDADGRLLSHAPLVEELPFCEWYRGEWKE